jgi:polyketide cyclase/dehydrase/lipid transport protein
MKTFDVQGIDLNVPRSKALAFIADPAQLPRWTNAFASVSPGQAVMRTPKGEVTIDLEVEASPEHGTVDWRMTFPDRSVATAFSRVVAMNGDRCIFSFVLTPPPVPLEQLEGALEAQSRTLAEELKKLKRILEHHG